MINNYNKFYLNMLSNYLLIKLKNNKVFIVNYLKKKKKIKLKFRKNRKKSLIILSSPNFYIFNFNLNKTIYFWDKKFNYNNIVVKNLLKLKIKWNFKKLKYHGKGYKIKKFNKINKITFRFGKSHWTKLNFNKKNIIVKRTKKNTYCFISTKFNIFFNILLLIKKIKGINKYTKRGVRLTRQAVKKRFGKISQASSVYK